ncbi:sensor histidine kinase [Polaribacter gochangensis]|uniref:sensor histidine kinase n=1 Tax=Polaribacter gochangensis TaxID=3252903 RepID=UPI0039046B0A
MFLILKKRDAIIEKYINNKTRYYNLFNNTLHGVIYTTNDGVIFALNKACLDIFNVTKAKVIEKSVYDLSSKLVDENLTPIALREHPVKNAILTKKVVSNVIVGYLSPKTNVYTWLKINCIPEFKRGNKKPYRICITIDDITLLKNYQKELEKSQEEIKDSLQKVALNEFLLKEANVMAKIGVYEINSKKDNINLSEEMYRIFNIPIEEEYPFEIVRKSFKEQSKILLNKVVNECMEKGTPFDVVLEIELRERPTVWARVIGKPIYGENNEIIGRRGIVKDITKSKNNQDKLEQSKIDLEESLAVVKRSEILLKEAGKLAKIGAYELLTEADEYYWSDEMYAIFGLEKGTEIPPEQEVNNLFTSKSKEKLLLAVVNLETKNIPFDLELELINFNQEYIWIHVIAKPIFNEDEKVIGRIGVMQNITDSKNVQLELELSKNKLEASLELAEKKDISLKEASKLAKIGYWEYDQLNDTVTWSEYIYHIYGADPKQDPPLQQKIVKVFDKKSQQKLMEANTRLIEKGDSYDLEFRIVNLKNEEIWIRNVVQPVFNEKNEVVGRRGVLQNITDSKKAQLELELSKNKLEASLNLVKENEYLLKEAGRMANIGYWGYDMQTNTNIWSEPIYKIYGVNPKDGVPELNVILSVFEEKSKKKLLKAMSNLTNNGVPFDIDLEMTNLKKEKRWIRNIGEPLYDAQNKIIGRKGVVQDITEPKKIMAQIDETEKMYRLLADNANDLICLHETDSTLVYLSPSIKDLLGYNRSELLGKPIFELIYKEDVLPLKKAIEERVFKDVDAEAFVFRIRHKKGHFIWLETLATSITKDNEIVSYVSSSRDITPWVLAKQEIQENQALLQKLTTEITLIEEKQKKEIATNIHDHLSQSLVISKMRINELKRNPVFKKVGKDLLFIEKHISEALENSRKITYELSPPVLYQLGIIDALNWLLDNIETTHKIKCELNCNVIHIKLSDVKAILLYRSIQEVVMNSIKYAKASSINLTIDKTDSEIQISIRDNGVGFDITTLNRKHHNKESDLGSGLGLFTIKERIRNIQGEFSILSEINVGTTAKIVVPLTQ